ncbi:MAG: MarR family winged helix-turn-helix transcriptional regulator [Rhodoferax sp.]
MSPTPTFTQEPNLPLSKLDDDNRTNPARVLRRFRVVFNAVRAHFQAIEKQAGLGGSQVWALNVVRDHPGIGVGALAKSMDIHQSTASNLVKLLLRKELISMGKASVDRRQVELQILPAGLAILSQVPGPFEGILPGALHQLPPASLLRLDHDLGELIALLKADENAAGIPLADL